MSQIGEKLMDIVRNPKNQAKVFKNIGNLMHSIANDLEKKGELTSNSIHNNPSNGLTK